MKKRNKLTVTVGIPAYNEAENISYLLKSILVQKQESYLLEKIIVVCDGCTDETLKIVKNFTKHYPVISAINGKYRRGKAYRLLQLYHKNTSDVIITFDGDIILSEPHVIETMTRHFEEKKVALVGANNQPINTETLIGNLVRIWKKLWYEVRKDVNRGDHVQNIKGCALAIRKSFAKSVKFPHEVISDAKIMYFQAISQNLRFHFAKEAIVYYRLPSNLQDYLLQTKKRGTPDKDKLAEIYGNWIVDSYKIPQVYKLRAFIRAFLQSPILLIFSSMLHLWLAHYPRNNNPQSDKLWQIIKSSKKGITI